MTDFAHSLSITLRKLFQQHGRHNACHKFLRQTCLEFADHARQWSRWSKADSEDLRARGDPHHAALLAPPSARWPSNGSASSSAAGKTTNPTTKTATSNNSNPNPSPTSPTSNPLEKNLRCLRLRFAQFWPHTVQWRAHGVAAARARFCLVWELLPQTKRPSRGSGLCACWRDSSNSEQRSKP